MIETKKDQHKNFHSNRFYQKVIFHLYSRYLQLQNDTFDSEKRKYL